MRAIGALSPVARPELEDAGVATGTLGVPGRHLGDQLVGHLLVAEVAHDLAVVVQTALAGLGDQLLGDGAQGLGLGLGGGDGLGGDEGCGEVGHHQPLVGGATAEPAGLAGVAGMGQLLGSAEREAPLVELLLDLVERLLAEVGDVEQVVLGLVDELTDRVDLRPLEAVAGTLRQVEVLDRVVEVRRAGADAGGPRRARGPGGFAHARRPDRPASAAWRRPRPTHRGA